MCRPERHLLSVCSHVLFSTKREQGEQTTTRRLCLDGSWILISHSWDANGCKVGHVGCILIRFQLQRSASVCTPRHLHFAQNVKHTQICNNFYFHLKHLHCKAKNRCFQTYRVVNVYQYVYLHSQNVRSGANLLLIARETWLLQHAP